jgi:hypothetical protein
MMLKLPIRVARISEDFFLFQTPPTSHHSGGLLGLRLSSSWVIQ